MSIQTSVAIHSLRELASLPGGQQDEWLRRLLPPRLLATYDIDLPTFHNREAERVVHLHADLEEASVRLEVWRQLSDPDPLLDFRFWILDFRFRSASMNEQQFKDRTKNLALRVIKLVAVLSQNRTAEVIGKQLLRSATSVGANYRAACRAKSTADIIAKLSIVEEEADESPYWMELLIESGMIPEVKLTDLMSETNEIIAMTVSSIKTLRARQTKSKI